MWSRWLDKSRFVYFGIEVFKGFSELLQNLFFACKFNLHQSLQEIFEERFSKIPRDTDNDEPPTPTPRPTPVMSGE